MTELTPKLKLKFELQTFIVIVVFVFGLGASYASLKSTQVQIISKLDTFTVLQQDMIVKRDADHKIINEQFARLSPTVHTIARKLGLE